MNSKSSKTRNIDPGDDALTAAKKVARARAKAQRAGNSPDLGKSLVGHVFRHHMPPKGATVAGFLSLADEIDTMPLLRELHFRGYRLVLPETPPVGQLLVFRTWFPGAPLEREKFGTLRPTGEVRAPDTILVPLLAFDRAGHRLGYGGGFYDRTLPLHPNATLLGIAFAAQEMDLVPVGPYDISLPAVATETGIVICGEHPRENPIPGGHRRPNGARRGRLGPA
jgi:5-formyltetrahydrofolate cyclo-ligase